MTEAENGTGEEGVVADAVEGVVAAPAEVPPVVEVTSEVVPDVATPEAPSGVTVTDAAEVAAPVDVAMSEVLVKPVVESGPEAPAPEIEPEPTPEPKTHAVQDEPAAKRPAAPSEEMKALESTLAPTPTPAAVSTTVSSVLKLGLEKIRFRKRAKLEKIVALAREKGSITNDDVQLAVQVSDSTATRYLTQLILAGRLRRSGPAERPKYEPV